MGGQQFQIQYLRAMPGQGLQQAALAAARGAADDDKAKTRRQLGQGLVDLAPVFLVAAIELHRLPAYLGQDMRHCATAVAPAPAVDQRLPVARLVQQGVFEVLADVARNQRRAFLLGLERTGLLVQGADLGALRIIQHRAVDGARNMVFGELRGAADIDDGVVAAEIGQHGGNG